MRQEAVPTETIQINEHYICEQISSINATQALFSPQECFLMMDIFKLKGFKHEKKDIQ